jgi:5,10-methylenetetrahydromethanopterin reductase
MASAIATVNEISGGRAFLGIGTGDSAVFNINERPRGLKGLREYILTLKELLRGEQTTFRERGIHTRWVASQKDNPVPIYIAAEGPKTLQLAGEIADGVICGMGLTPDVIEATLGHIETGAKRAGRSMDDLDIWAFAKVNVGQDRADLIREVRMELASTAHHAFQFTLEGKLVPPEFEDALHRIQTQYQPTQHLGLGETSNARLMEDPGLMSYLVERFAVLGTADECVQQVAKIRSAGINQILFTGNIENRAALIRALGSEVLPRCRN